MLYVVAPYSGPPDVWCITLLLSAALPASGGDHAAWTIAAGVPPAAQANIDAQDPDAKVLAPGYVLARNPGR